MDFENNLCFQKASKVSYIKDLSDSCFISSPKTASRDGSASSFASDFILSVLCEAQCFLPGTFRQFDNTSDGHSIPGYHLM